jgi:hypothetical protein
MQKYLLIAAIAALVSLLSVAGFSYGLRFLTNRDDPSMEQIIAQLRSADSEIRYAAFEQLQTHAKTGLTRLEGLAALRAATDTFPPQKHDWQDASAELVNAAAGAPRPEYVSVVSANFATYSGKAKEQSLALLGRLPERIAAETYVALLKTYGRDGSLSYLPKGSFADEPRHAEVLFPALLDLADVPALQWNIYMLCLSYLEHGTLKPEELANHTREIVDAYRRHESKLKPLQRNTGVAWMWEDDYQELRSDAALLLDVLGYVPGPAVEAQLADAARFEDPRLAFFAVRSLLRKGGHVPEEVLVRIAASAETRNLLFSSLEKLGHPDLFPKAWATQEALAESDMVGWLTYPTELARVPDQIELMKVVSEDVGGDDGMLDFYLYRFRTLPPHWAAKDGWMAGVAGPFRRAGAPSATSYGSTFSTFEKWDDKRPEEHVEAVREVLREWAKENGAG